MTHRLTNNYAKNYCNRTLIVKVIAENIVTCLFWDTVYIPIMIVDFVVVYHNVRDVVYKTVKL